MYQASNNLLPHISLKRFNYNNKLYFFIPIKEASLI